VIVTEIGQIKKDIAYHGDVLNTTDRIQSQCNVYGKNLLISEKLTHYWAAGERQQSHFIFQPIGTVGLKGKELPVTIYSVETSPEG
jgi:adenylate cyclase